MTKKTTSRRKTAKSAGSAKTTRTKGSSSGRTRSTGSSGKAKNTGRRYELLGLALLAAGLLSLCGIFGLNVGFVGLYFAKFLRYFFGVGAIVIAFLILLIAWQYITKHSGPRYTPRFFGLLALFVCVLAIYHHFVIPVGAEIMPDSLPKGGGLLGGGLLLLLRKFFGVDGTIIILGAGVVGAILLSTTWSLATGLLKTKEQAKKGAIVAGSAISSTCERVAEVGSRMEEQLTETVREKMQRRSSFYDQDEDPHFAEKDEPVAHLASDRYDDMTEIRDEPAELTPERTPEPDYGAYGLEPVEKPAAEEDETPHFTIEYGHGGQAAESPIQAAPDEPAAHVEVPHTQPVVPPSPHPMKKNPVPAPSYEEIAPIMPAAALLDGSAKGPLPHTGEEQAAGTPPQPEPRPYVLPRVTEILSKHVKKHNAALEIEIEDKARILQKTLEDFHVKARIINACHGPAVTRYELEPAPGVKVSKITNLADDLALSLAATSVRIEPIPGKAAIGIEVPNKELEGVQLREVLENEKFLTAKSKLTVGLGMDIGGQAIFADLAKMPHLLVAGATGSGKSVCINTLITSILFKAKPEEVKFILVDPKMVELSNYNGIPHLMVPVVTEAKKAASVLNWSVQEMEKRYAKFAEHNVRNMETYNTKFPDDKMPAIVIIIDELADLMMVAPHDVEDAICRLAQKARAAGIHMVLATQRPSVDVITGIIKANIPSRISFAVSSQIDSRTILDRSGAEKLLGKGDMLFYPVGAAKPVRVQGAFISDDEVEHLLDFIRAQGQEMEANEEIITFTENAMKEEEEKEEGKGRRAPKRDELLPDAVNLVMSTGQASASSIQRRFRVGYTRAARLIDEMEELHIVGPNMGSKPREILMNSEQAQAALAAEAET